MTTTRTMPKRVQDALIAAGDLTPDRISAKPRPRRCPTCGAWCLAAIPAWQVGATYVEPAPTTSLGELLALTSGRRTYSVVDGAMEKRAAYEIRLTPADRAGWVHAAHECSQPQEHFHPTYSPPSRRRNPFAGEPPY